MRNGQTMVSDTVWTGLGKLDLLTVCIHGKMGECFQYIKDNKPGVIPWDVAGNGSIYVMCCCWMD